jgi:hypothetical protein
MLELYPNAVEGLESHLVLLLQVVGEAFGFRIDSVVPKGYKCVDGQSKVLLELLNSAQGEYEFLVLTKTMPSLCFPSTCSTISLARHDSLLMQATRDACFSALTSRDSDTETGEMDVSRGDY